MSKVEELNNRIDKIEKEVENLKRLLQELKASIEIKNCPINKYIQSHHPMG